jgi:hypothetical protein
MSSAMPATSSSDLPACAACAAATTWLPRPDVTERESTTRIGASAPTARAAFCADWIVADSSADLLQPDKRQFGTLMAPEYLFPGVPFYNLPELHEALMSDDAYRSKAHVTRGYSTGLVRECLA